METKLNSEKQVKHNKTRQIVSVVVVVVLVAVLFVAAQHLVSQIDVLDLLKKLHGG